MLSQPQQVAPSPSPKRRRFATETKPTAEYTEVEIKDLTIINDVAMQLVKSVAEAKKKNDEQMKAVADAGAAAAKSASLPAGKAAAAAAAATKHAALRAQLSEKWKKLKTAAEKAEKKEVEATRNEIKSLAASKAAMTKGNADNIARCAKM